MPATTISNVIRNAWKALALADQTDADEVLAVLKAALASLEELEAGE